MGDKVKAPKAQKPKESGEVKVKEKRSTGSKVSLIIGIVLCVILVPILVLNSVLIIKGFTSAPKPPDLFGYVPLTVASPSMYPLFDEGDMIIVKQVDPDTIEEGDVICFLDPAQEGKVLLTHRVVKIEKDEEGNRVARTAGDFNVDIAYINADDKSTYEKVLDSNKDGYSYWKSADESQYDRTPVPLDDETIVGVYDYAVLPNFGHISNFMAQPYGWIICISVPLVAFVLYEVISRKKSDKGKQKDMDALLAELEALKAEKEAASKAANVLDESEGASEATQSADNTEEAEDSGGNSEENT